MQTSLIHPNGSYNRAAIKAAVNSEVAAHHDFAAQYTGSAYLFWCHRIREDAATKVLREASAQRASYIQARMIVVYSDGEKQLLEALDCAAEACPITYNGNVLAAEYRAKAQTIRARARDEAIAYVVARIMHEARSAALQRRAA